jgi:hypothetical protein
LSPFCAALSAISCASPLVSHLRPAFAHVVPC